MMMIHKQFHFFITHCFSVYKKQGGGGVGVLICAALCVRQTYVRNIRRPAASRGDADKMFEWRFQKPSIQRDANHKECLTDAQ